MPDPMDEVRDLVLGDVDLYRSLAEITDREQFSRVLIDVADQHGVRLDAVGIDRAVVGARRRWWARWV